jgi:hypothetical protein
MLAAPALAQTFTEKGDAGVTEATAAIVPPKVNRIVGTLKPGTGNAFQANPADVDVYAFTLSQTTDVLIDAKSTFFDMNLLLLREGFFGIFGDDDGGSGNDSRVPNDGNPLVLPPGTYYVAVGINNIGAYPVGATMPGSDIWDNDSSRLAGADLTTPIMLIGSEDENPDPTTGQSYEILFNFTTSVTGIDLSAGKSTKSLKGIDIVNRTGKGQAVSLTGRTSARFVLNLSNTGADRKVQGGLTKASRSSDVTIKQLGGGGNVTAAFKRGRYSKKVASGSGLRYSVLVKGNDSKVLVTLADAAKKSISDTAGAKVRFR